ncbi:MFS transporter [Massilia sp. W12]|uniref:MFS transporter n=1 Tax=Massilia sp. W12 TaxID=3126507 RepID=UPI0030D22430
MNPPALSRRAALAIFLCFAAAYVMSYAMRSVNAVLGPVLMQEFSLSSRDLGLLSAMYFLSFASVQLPLGIWLDRYGARRVEAGLLLFAVAGALLYACAQNFWQLCLGRAMIGLGVSSCLMAAYKAYRQWYPRQQQSRLAACMMVAGTAGALSVSSPVAYALPVFGWRPLFWLAALIFIALAILIFFALAPVERRFEAPPQAVASAGAGGYGALFSDPFFWRYGMLALLNQAVFVAWQTLWTGPWLQEVLAFSSLQSGVILFYFNLALLLGYLAFAWAAPRYIRSGHEHGAPAEWVIGGGFALCLLLQIGIAAFVAPSSWGLWLLLAFCASVASLPQTHLSLAYPAEMAGRVNSAFNLLVFVGVFCAQSLIGVLIDAFVAQGASRALAMRSALGVCILAQALSLLYFCCAKARAPR